MTETTCIVPQPEAETAAAFTERWGAIADIATLRTLQVNLPERHDEASEIYDRVAAAERRLVAPRLLLADYAEGTAHADDQVTIEYARRSGLLLIGADHATDPVRKATGVREGADHGTAGLAALLTAENYGDTVLPAGRQTGNATVTPDYPYKNMLKALMYQRHSTGVLSVHGMRPGLVREPSDTSEAHALVGLGQHEPLPQTIAAAEAFRQRAADELGLRVLISNHEPHIIYQNDPEWSRGGPICDKQNAIKINELGQPARSRLAALGAHSTANFVMQNQPADRAVPVYQLEISRSLRLTPEDAFTRDQGALRQGVYVGYLLTKLAAETLHNQAILKA